MARLINTQRIAISGTSAISTTLTKGLRYALVASADCTIRQGGSGVAAAADTANNFFLAKGVILEITVTTTGASGDSFIAVIGTGGSLYIATVEGS